MTERAGVTESGSVPVKQGEMAYLDGPLGEALDATAVETSGIGPRVAVGLHGPDEVALLHFGEVSEDLAADVGHALDALEHRGGEYDAAVVATGNQNDDRVNAVVEEVSDRGIEVQADTRSAARAGLEASVDADERLDPGPKSLGVDLDEGFYRPDGLAVDQPSPERLSELLATRGRVLEDRIASVVADRDLGIVPVGDVYSAAKSSEERTGADQRR